MARPRKKRLMAMLVRKGATPAEKMVAASALEKEKRANKVANIKIDKKKKRKAKPAKPSKVIEHPELEMVAEYDKKKAKEREEIARMKTKKKKKTERLKGAKLLTSKQIAQINHHIKNFNFFVDTSFPRLHLDIKRQLEIMAENYLREDPKRLKMRLSELFGKVYPPAPGWATNEQVYFNQWRKYGSDKVRKGEWKHKLLADQKLLADLKKWGALPTRQELLDPHYVNMYYDALCFIESHANHYRISSLDQKKFYREALSTFEAHKIFLENKKKRTARQRKP